MGQREPLPAGFVLVLSEVVTKGLFDFQWQGVLAFDLVGVILFPAVDRA